MQKLNIDITIDVDKDMFTKDFLQIEVAKKLAIHGDDLLFRIREICRDDARQYGKLFSRDILYSCEGIENDKVKLIGTYKNK